MSQYSSTVSFNAVLCTMVIFSYGKILNKLFVNYFTGMFGLFQISDVKLSFFIFIFNRVRVGWASFGRPDSSVGTQIAQYLVCLAVFR